jgi:hypothetical protein
LEAFPAEHRAPLRGPERNRRIFPTLRASGLGFRSHLGSPGWAAATFGTLGLACLATLRLVFKTFVGKKHLFAGSKNKLSAALRTLQDLIVVFHEPFPSTAFGQRGRGSACTFGLSEA